MLQLKKKSHPSCLPSLSLTYVLYLLSLQNLYFQSAVKDKIHSSRKKHGHVFLSVLIWSHMMVWITELLTHKLRKSSNVPALRHIERYFFPVFVFFFNFVLPEIHKVIMGVRGGKWDNPLKLRSFGLTRVHFYI